MATKPISLGKVLARQEDPWVYNLAQFTFGLNPACTEFTGEMLNDEGVNGTVHIGIGTPANLGGEVTAKTHFDAITRAPGPGSMVNWCFRTGRSSLTGTE